MTVYEMRYECSRYVITAVRCEVDVDVEVIGLARSPTSSAPHRLPTMPPSPRPAVTLPSLRTHIVFASKPTTSHMTIAQSIPGTSLSCTITHLLLAQ